MDSNQVTSIQDLSPPNAKHWDVVIVGAGPAGSTCGFYLAQEGLKVLIVEKDSFPRYKVCGACLHPHTVELIKKIEPNILRLAKPVTKVGVFTGSRHLEYASNGGLILSREKLDYLLLEKAIETGVTVMMSTKFKSYSLQGSKCKLIVEGKETLELTARVIVDASGLGGIDRGAYDRVAPKSFIGVGTVIKSKASFDTSSIAMHLLKSGYFGTSVLEDGSINIAAAVPQKGFKEPLESALKTFFAQDPSIQDSTDSFGTEKFHWRGTLALSRTGIISKPRYFAIGDAAGYVEPFTGEGIKWAVLGGKNVIPAILKTLSGKVEEGMVVWQNEYENSIQKDKRFCKNLRLLLRTPKSLLQPLIKIAPQFSTKCLSYISRGNPPWVS